MAGTSGEPQLSGDPVRQIKPEATAAIDDDAGPAISHRPGLLLTTLLGGNFLGNIDIAVVNVATPSIHANLHASAAALQLIISGYTLVYAVLLIIAARLGDLHGYRSMFRIGLGIFTSASLTCGLAPEATVLILARLLQGAGAAMMISQVLTGIQLNFAGRARARALGAYSAVLAGSAVVGQILGGVLVQANLFGASWRPIFLINVPLGLLLLASAGRYLPPTRPRGRVGLDIPGVAALTLALFLVAVPLILGRPTGWPVWIMVALLASLPALGLFVAIERRQHAHHGYPLIDLGLLARPPIAWGLSAAALGTAAYYALLFVLAQYLQQGLNNSPTYSGLALIPWVAAFGVGGLTLGRLSERAQKLAAPLGGLALAVVYAAISASITAGATAGTTLIILLALGGLSWGFTFTAIIGYLTGAVTSQHASDMSGLINTTLQLGGAIGVAALGTLYFALVGRDPGRSLAVHGFAVFTLAIAATVLAAAVAALLSIRPVVS